MELRTFQVAVLLLIYHIHIHSLYNQSLQAASGLLV